MSVNFQSDDVTDCSQVKFSSDDGEIARGEEQMTIARGQVSSLEVRGANNGPVLVRGWERDEYGVKVCKAAVGANQNEAEQRLQQIKIALNGNQLTVTEPQSGENYAVYLIVQAPRNADLQVGAVNGPIALRQVSGKVSAHATNGPVDVHGCSGDITVHTQNGPIELQEGSGTVRLEASNGPIEVELSGAQWDGGSLEARSENGPLSLKLPASYRSAVRVESAGRSPFRCAAATCENARKNWDDDRQWVEFGAGAPVVRLSTVNGPVEIKSRVAEF